jgi:hypothetical protein
LTARENWQRNILHCNLDTDLAEPYGKRDIPRKRKRNTTVSVTARKLSAECRYIIAVSGGGAHCVAHRMIPASNTSQSVTDFKRSILEIIPHSILELNVLFVSDVRPTVKARG